MQTNQQTFTQSQWGNWTPYIMPAAVHRTPGYGYESQLQGHCCSCCMPSFKSLLLDQEIIITNGGDFPRRRLDISHYNQWGWFSLQKVRYIVWESLEIGHMTCNCSNPAKKAVVLLCVNIILLCSLLPSVLWRCWLGSRKGIRPVKNWAVGCWHGYLSGARCRLAYGPADATATHCLLLQ